MERRPSANGVRAAAARLAGVVNETPLLPLDHAGRRLWVKAECLQPGGSFKLRGASNRLLLLSAAGRRAGVVAFSSANHAQGAGDALGWWWSPRRARASPKEKTSRCSSTN